MIPQNTFDVRDFYELFYLVAVIFMNPFYLYSLSYPPYIF